MNVCRDSTSEFSFCLQCLAEIVPHGTFGKPTTEKKLHDVGFRATFSVEAGEQVFQVLLDPLSFGGGELVPLGDLDFLREDFWTSWTLRSGRGALEDGGVSFLRIRTWLHFSGWGARERGRCSIQREREGGAVKSAEKNRRRPPSPSFLRVHLYEADTAVRGEPRRTSTREAEATRAACASRASASGRARVGERGVGERDRGERGERRGGGERAGRAEWSVATFGEVHLAHDFDRLASLFQIAAADFGQPLLHSFQLRLVVEHDVEGELPREELGLVHALQERFEVFQLVAHERATVGKRKGRETL